MKKILLLTVCFLLWACQPTAGKPLAELLRSDGTPDLSAGFNGSVDVSGYRLDTDDNGAPRFVSDASVMSDGSPIHPEILENDPADDDIYWENLFGGHYEAEINVIVLVDGNLYVGGKFERIGGIEANNIAKWDGESWYALGSGIEDDHYLNASVHALAVMGDDLYAGGWFDRAGGQQANHIAKWDGENWSDLDEGLNGHVRAFAVAGDTLYAGGDFTIAGIARVNSVARWDGSNWSALGTGFSHGGYDASVKALAVAGNSLYAAGWFSGAGDAAVNNIARWDGESWAALGSGIEGARLDWVYALAVKGDKIYAGGKFTTAGGTAVNNIAEWDGSSWSALGAGQNLARVYALAVIGEDLYAGGMFNNPTHDWSSYMQNIARWDGNSWSVLDSGMNASVQTLAASGDGMLYAGGEFCNAGGVPSGRLAKWDGANWSAIVEPLPTLKGGLNALAFMDGELYAGGYFDYAGGVEVNRIAKWDGNRWSALESGISGEVETLAVMGNHLYVGGRILTAGTTEVNNIARWDGQSWSALGSGVEGGYDGWPEVYALAVAGDTLYAAGDFTIAGGKEAKYVAQWDGETWSALGPGLEGGYMTEVRSLAFMKNRLYAGGRFTTAGETPVSRIAEWDGTKWSALGSGVEDGSLAGVNALAVMGETLYAGGLFTTVGGTTVNHIAKWNGEQWSALGTGIEGDHNTSVRALTVVGSELYMGGLFSTAGGAAAKGIARWDGQSWSPLGSGQNAGHPMTFTGNDLYVGVARWSKPVAAAAVTRNLTTPQSAPLSFNEPDDVTGVSIMITKPSGGPVIHAFRYEDAPKDPLGIGGNVSRYRWIIQQTGLAYPFASETEGAEVRFRVSDIPEFGETNPEDVVIYSRSAPVTGYFLPLETSYDSQTGEIVAQGVTDFGEFALGNVATRAEDPTDGLDAPGEYLLEQNYPNPFNPSTTIPYVLSQRSSVRLVIYNTLGQHIAALVHAEQGAGNHEAVWHPGKFASGIYFYRLDAVPVNNPENRAIMIRKMILLK
ncbi:MAG: T9SS type A sorting domain-containing protein [Cyclonatronaceae bacterium]